ncbi:bifunctional [glutamate--ammonia ligase]-adenylyl-L-tyrosine phosphorylase/[glutamate--ammonia-ligase] adenylyltransferase, partial [Kaarinaea lacus]
IAGWSDLQETVVDLSNLAEACIAAAVDLLQHWLEQSVGKPCDSDGNRQAMIVVAMGKLGAHELNFSSDVDLIFVFPQNGTTQGASRSISNDEFFSRLGRQLITVLDQITPEGQVFRVDMRLRPFGDSGPLVSSFDAMESYYQIHGREWERYAMVKARALTGGEAGHQLMQMLKPFVYRRYLDFGSYDSLRDMKKRIEAEIHKKGMRDNIKLGPGGIREVEFIGQAFQLIRGGREPELQQRQILTILQLLAEKDYLPSYVVNELSQAYIFLRTVEHRLQQFADQQTHKLPQDDIACIRLAYSMGFASWDDFNRVLEKHRQRVQNHFEQVFAAPQVEHESEDKYSLREVWLELLEEGVAYEVLTKAGFSEPQQALDYIKATHRTTAYVSLSRQGKERMDKLMPLLLGAVGHYDNENRVLKRLLDLLEAIARRTSYLALLGENPMALSQLVRLCAASPWIVHQIAKQPVVLDELLDPRTLYLPPSRESLIQDLQQRMEYIDEQDLEQQMDALRHFKHANVLRVAAADVSEAMPLMVVSDHLTDIAELVLNQVLQIAWQHMVRRHGLPGHANNNIESCGFAVIAYGKMGGIELGYGSDLDLVFLYHGDANGFTDGEKSIANSVFYSRLGQRMIHILTSFTPAGVLYEVDMRLRPSGASGLLVTHVDSFRDYQFNQAWTWEHQALVRARPTTGDESVMRRFSEIRNEVLSQPREQAVVREEVRNMRERMRTELVPAGQKDFDLKQGLGGIADIEFMVQYTVLARAAEYPSLLVYSDNIRILEAMMANDLISDTNGKTLIECYKVFRALVHRLTLQEESATTQDEHIVVLSQKVAAQWQALMTNESHEK